MGGGVDGGFFVNMLCVWFGIHCFVFGRVCELCFGSLWGNVGFELNGVLFLLCGTTF